jgi:integration host factor subunit beta
MADNKYTKTDIIDSLYEKTGINKGEIRAVIELFAGEIKDALVKQRTIELRGFGTFEVRVRKGRSRARNPKTGEPIAVSPHGIAVFRAGQELKRMLWQLPGGSRTPETEGLRGEAAAEGAGQGNTGGEQ